MHEARVLVVDDSAAMRALFSDILDEAKNVRVVGVAANAGAAREQIAELKPNVITLDVEMPGMSGIEFLAEIMETNPLPVVMLSSLTQAGTETSLKAYELGAVECFPKPLKATPEQFSKTVGKLGKIVLAAANSNVHDRKARPEHKSAADAPFEWAHRRVQRLDGRDRRADDNPLAVSGQLPADRGVPAGRADGGRDLHQAAGHRSQM